MCSNAGYAMSGSGTTVASQSYKDMASSSEANDFFGTYDDDGMYPDWVKATTQGERDSVSWYTGSSYADLNDRLRSGEELTAYQKQKLKNLDKAMKKFDLKENITVYRGSSAALLGGMTDPDDINRVLKGKVVRDKGFMSTSAVKGANFGGSIEYRINVRAGKGKGVWAKPISNFKNEEEFLLARGTEFKVLRAERHPTSSNKTIVYLEC